MQYVGQNKNFIPFWSGRTVWNSKYSPGLETVVPGPKAMTARVRVRGRLALRSEPHGGGLTLAVRNQIDAAHDQGDPADTQRAQRIAEQRVADQCGQHEAQADERIGLRYLNA